MAKKKKKTKPRHRNAAPRISRAPRREEETPGKRLAVTAAGAASTALIGSFLARQGWAPRTVAGALAALGGGLAWKGDGAAVRSVGAGAMSAAGSQLALMLIDDRERKASTGGKRNAEELPPDALAAAMERARSRLALASDELPEELAA